VPCHADVCRGHANAKAQSVADAPRQGRPSVFGPLRTLASARCAQRLACDRRASQGRRAPSHSMSPGPGCARPSSFTSVGGCPPPLACSRLGVRRSKTDTRTSRGQWVPFSVSKGGGAGAARPGGHGGEGNTLASARATVACGDLHKLTDRNWPNTVVGASTCLLRSIRSRVRYPTRPPRARSAPGSAPRGIRPTRAGRCSSRPGRCARARKRRARGRLSAPAQARWHGRRRRRRR
jgi:hypothetical protein